MKVSISWVKQFTDITLEKDELLKAIGAQLGAVESVEDWGSYYDEQIVIGEITEAKSHPDADKLGVYTVSIGSEARQLVAGDKSLIVGNKVAYIQPGARVPISVKEGEPFEITERELRGVMSQGMLGSAQELLLSDEHSGVQVFPDDTEVGVPLRSLYGLDDLIVDIENKMFTHRPDCFGIMGVAREIAAIQGSTFASPDWWLQEQMVSPDEGASLLPLEIANEIPDVVPRFTAIVLSNVTVADSPIAMKSMLFRVGMRPINNVVDISNYIMHETGQPTHAFDYDKVAAADGTKNASLVVRYATGSDELTLLDDRIITPSKETIMICSKTKHLSVAGSIGGKESEVDNNTKNIILEVANFDMYSIRRTSFRHGIFTDAVTRFNKGQSPEQCIRSSARAISMLLAKTGAKVASEMKDIYSKASQVTISTTAEFINTRLGCNLSNDEIGEVLQRTEFVVEDIDDTLNVIVPFWRTDILHQEDIVEEVGRIIGFDSLPIVLPRHDIKPMTRSSMLQFKDVVRGVMASGGAQEVYTYAFVSEKMLQSYADPKSVQESSYRIRNSISPELQFMRQTVFPSIVSKLHQNIRLGYEQIQLFEIQKVHNNNELTSDVLPEERMVLSAAYAMSTIAAKKNNVEVAYYHAKAMLENLLRDLGDIVVSFEKTSKSSNRWLSSLAGTFDENRSAYVICRGQTIGMIGECSQALERAYKSPRITAGFEIDLALLQSQYSGRTYSPISPFPSTSQDITLETQASFSFAEIQKSLVDELHSVIDGTFDFSVSPISIFKPEDSENIRYSFRITMQSQASTLVTTEINKLIDQVAAKLAEKDMKRL